MSEAEKAVHPIFDAQAAPAAPAEPEVALDPALMEAIHANLKSQQNFLAAIGGGLISAIVGAVVWAAVTVVTKYQIGWMAVGLGVIVGLAVRKYGKGISPAYGCIGAVLSLIGCLLGNLLSYGGFVAQQQGLPLIQTELMLLSNPMAAVELLKATFEPMDVLFYAIAVYEGYRFSFNEISEAQLAALLRSQPAEENQDA